MRIILPDLGIVTAAEPATYLLTPFQRGELVLQAFIARVKKRFRSMTYGTTLPVFFDGLVAMKEAGVDVRCIFDHTQACGKAEKAHIEALVGAGFVDGKDFLIGTSPEHHAINHLKACWADDGYVLHGSWNYSASADQQYNSIEVVTSPELLTLFDKAFEFAWTWILANEEAYQTFSREVTP